MSSILGSLLTEQGKNNNIPAVLFTDNADLRSVIKRAATKTEGSEVSLENINTVIDEYIALDNDHDENSELGIFNRIADAFAGKLSEGIEALHKIHKTVSDLTEEINERAAMRIAEDSTLSKVFNIERDIKMDNIQWNLLDIVDERSLRMIAHDSINIPIDRESTPSIVDLIINKMPCANQYNTLDMSKVEIPDDKFSSIVDKIHAAFPDESREFVAGCVRNIFNLDTTSAQRAVAAAKQFVAGKTASNINHIMRVIAGYYKVLSMMDEDTLDLAQSTMTELNKHIETFNAITNTMAYICFYYRNNVWKDAIIVPGPLCNSDNMESFTEDGGTDSQLVQHHTRFYKDVKVPTKGISGKFVLQTAKEVEDQFSAEAVRDAAKINQRKADIDRNAFVLVTTNYLNANRDKFCKSFNQSNLSLYAKSIYDSNHGQPTESKLYKAIFGSQYVGTIVPKIYDCLNKAYIDYTSTVGNMSEQACEELDIAVYSDMIAEHLVDQGILII